VSDAEQDEIIKEFVVEANENLDLLDRELMALEQNPNTPGLLATVFRRVHTVKGACGFIGFSRLESVAHVAENLLSKVRDEEIELSPAIVTALLATADAMREILSGIEANGKEREHDFSELIITLNRLQGATPEPAAPAVAPSPPAAAAPVVAAPVVAAPVVAAPVVAAPVVAAAPVVVVAPVVAAPRPRPPAPLPAPPPPPPPSPAPEPAPATKAAGPAAPPPAAEPAEARVAAAADSNLRVDVALLDKLMNLVGELVLARNQVLQVAPSVADPNFTATSQRLNLITTELQSGVMKTRMQPIRNIWEKLPRVVRDLSLTCGKQVRVEMQGSETELDKTIIEAIKDPLTHLVRNCIDHGVERPADRVAAGKNAEGRLLLRAFHEGGQVNIEISDDGHGINLEAIKNKALEKGLITREQAARMSDRDLQNLIFLPGLSTAAKISNVSGRGVGMDVVKTNIEKIGGVVDVQTRSGLGTTFRIKIPLTLAIIPALVVTSGGDRYAVPQISLLELVRLKGAHAHSRIEIIQGAPVYRLRGNLLPLVYLNRELQIEDDPTSDAETVNIVVLQADNRRFGLVVDQVNDTEEIVVKPLGQHLKGITAFAGATIMGDGRVALILDIVGIAQHANVIGAAHDRGLTQKTSAQEGRQGERRTLLLVLTRDGRRMAIPLSTVARLEEFPRKAVERLGERTVVQYRGRILPLVDMVDLVNGRTSSAPPDADPGAEAAGAETVQVVVYGHGQRSLGMMVGKILDIVDQAADSPLAGEGMAAGCAVIQQKVTELVDLDDLMQRSDGAFLQAGSSSAIEAGAGA
jgi:two-component system, chemotaxis family, sensor kinase CheA